MGPLAAIADRLRRKKNTPTELSLIMQELIVEGADVGQAIAASKLVDVTEDVEKGLAVVNQILECSDQEFASKKFILGQLFDFGLAGVTKTWKLVQPYADSQNASMFGTLQFPTEFVDYLMECARYKPETVCEIGVYTGGSAYFAAAVLQRANPEMTYTMIDIADQLIEYDAFAQILNLDKQVPSVARDHKGQEFDLVFIDADHSYDGARLDYEYLGQYAKKLVGFHDIHAREYNHLDGGVLRFWREVKEQNSSTARIIEFAHSPVRWMGIGLIDKTV